MNEINLMGYFSEKVEIVEEKLDLKVANANLITPVYLHSRSHVQHVLSTAPSTSVMTLRVNLRFSSSFTSRFNETQTYL